jgi:hypothetical protein
MRGWGGVEPGGGELGIYAKRGWEIAPGGKVRIAILKSRLTGVNPCMRRPRDAGESVDPSELPASDEPMPCPQ